MPLPEKRPHWFFVTPTFYDWPFMEDQSYEETCRDLDSLWEGYVLCPDEGLAGCARALKYKLLDEYRRQYLVKAHLL